MTKEQANKLADALESGLYKQGRECLYNNDNTFCCLGVVADINSCLDKSDEQFLLSDIQQALVGIKTGRGMFYNGVEMNGIYCDSLASMNDKGVSFKEIAHYIRNNYENIV